MDGIIICGSQYGTAAQYAQKLSEMTGLPAVRHESIPPLSACRTVVHIGALYAGGVLGLKDTLRALPPAAKLFIVTVGLSDVTDAENVAHIRAALQRQMPREVYDAAAVFHLRGGIDYGKLSLKHKTMMALLYRKAKGLPAEKKTAEVRAMLDTYGKQVSFVDPEALAPIRAALAESG